MRKNLESVPVQISLGRVPADLADEVVIAGDALSLKGKAILMLSPAGLERLLTKMDVRPEIVAAIVRAAARVEAEKVSVSQKTDGARITESEAQ